MSRQNKVNPGMYTQRGRLTQDDAARELKRQRSIGSEHTWQPSKKDQFPRLASSNDDAVLGAETSGDNESGDTTAPHSTTAKSRTAKKTTGKAKAAKAAKPAAKRAATKTARKAVLARNVGGLRLRSGQPRVESRGSGAKPRTTAKRRKS